MGKPGLYISLQRQVASGETAKAETIVPFTEQFTFSCTQKYFKPIKELFESSKKFISGLAKVNPLVSSGTEAAMQIPRLFGIQMFQKAFKAQAWEDSDPTSIGVALNFFFGMQDKFDAKIEVYDQVMSMMKVTVPEDVSEEEAKFLVAPAPNALQVYKDFATNLFDFDIFSKIEDNTVKYSGKVWKLKLGYSSNGTSINPALLTLNGLVIENSSFKFGTDLDENGYPLNGTVNLTFTTQTVITSATFGT